MKKSIFIGLLLSLSLNLFAQKKSEIKVFPQDTSEFTHEKIINGLVGYGIEIKDVETNFTSESHVMGFFIDPVRYMGIGQGMILSTGVVDNLTKANSQENYSSFEYPKELTKGVNVIVELEDKKFPSVGDTITADYTISATTPTSPVVAAALVKGGDEDLSAEIEGLKTFDARVLEIKFVPTADTFYYRYIFASEEYDEYVCTRYNDIFGFYLYEEGGKKKNVALVPGKNQPVSINTINNGNPNNPACEKSNAYLYKKNDGKQNLLFDGFTRVLDIRQKVTPGKEYIMKIAIADASDGVWDSAVMIENGSIFSYFNSFEVQFNKNQSATHEDKKLQKILKELKKYPKSKILLIGHADRSGSEAYNFNISIKRVKSIRTYLESNGISSERFIESYKGESMPRYDTDSRNRRVEVFIVG